MPFFLKKQFSKSFLKEKTITQLTSEQLSLNWVGPLIRGIFSIHMCTVNVGLPGGSLGKESTSNALDTGDVCSIPGMGRSPGEGNGNPFQYSCLENPMDRGAGLSTVHRAVKSWTRLNRLSTHAL